ncbi:MAG: rod shape-determining protein [Acidobacteriota bacterium]
MGFLTRSSLAIRLAIDLGTVTTLIHEEGHGLIVNEPTIIALAKHTGKVVAVGSEALDMLGRAPRNVMHVHPLKDGAIADFDATEKMLRALIGRAVRGRFWRPLHVVIAIQNQSTPVERRAVRESVRKAHARQVDMVEEGIAVGWGVGIPIQEPQAAMVIDIGGGTTNITVLASSGIVCSRTLTVAGNEINEAIISYVKRERSMLISERTAEEIKIRLGSLTTLEEELSYEIIGKGLCDSVPHAITITSHEIRPGLTNIMNLIADEVLTVLDYVSPQTLADIFQRGIIVTGGSALIRNIDRFLADRLQIRVFCSEDPLNSVVTGISRIVRDTSLLARVRLKECANDWRAAEALIVGTPY